jgi:hypothetical protein
MWPDPKTRMIKRTGLTEIIKQTHFYMQNQGVYRPKINLLRFLLIDNFCVLFNMVATKTCLSRPIST